MKNGTAVTSLSLLFAAFCLVDSGCASHPLPLQEAKYPAEKVDARGLFEQN